MKDEDLRELLEKNLLLFSPEKYLPKYVKNIRDVYNNRSILKHLSCNEYTLNYLLDLIIKTVDEGKRFRTLDCLRVIKAIVKNKPQSLTLNDLTIAKLFHLYKRFIFDRREDVQWCVSIFIKSQFLRDDDIEWLVLNYYKSEHLVNRLLLYPAKHPMIVEWATKVYKNGELQRRKSSVISLLIDEDIPIFVNKNDSEVIIWAIYYAKISDEAKQKLLMKYFSFKHLETILDICMRLEYPEVIEYALTKI